MGSLGRQEEIEPWLPKRFVCVCVMLEVYCSDMKKTRGKKKRLGLHPWVSRRGRYGRFDLMSVSETGTEHISASWLMFIRHMMTFVGQNCVKTGLSLWRLDPHVHFLSRTVDAVDL